ncbi:MAG: hypothetical protein IVW55_06730 [Chloroflexi bacterium]|nr:hypothetical protein [Chloroflexota bacterium]
MNSYNTNQDASPQPGAEQGATHHFPPVQGSYSQGPPTLQPTYNQEQAQPPQAPQYQPAQSTGVSSYGSYSQRGPQPAERRGRDRTMLGLILIGGGLLFGLTEFSIIPGFGNMVLLLVGAIFMYAYFQTRPGYRVGFLIPGAILLGIGAGELLSSLAFVSFWRGGDITAFTLGLGFCLIWAFERKHWWALIPGGILVLSSLSSVWMIGNLWPLALIVLGAYLLIDQSRRKQMR